MMYIRIKLRPNHVIVHHIECLTEHLALQRGMAPAYRTLSPCRHPCRGLHSNGVQQDDQT